ncbi:MAG TPA: alpha/beta hydrolase family protein [Pyrinomonadaceae bacterium]|jgi:S-formylglutathione hydrolase FrmB|nr:alpha/beta hydrolase family protein [Pyrinomonadaceae bacterium]
MLKYARAFLVIALLLPLHVFAQEKAAAPANVRAPQTAASDNQRLQTIQFQSKLVGQTLPYIVVLPVNYDQPAARSERYPVLYLLHGLTGHYDNWTTRTKLADYAARYSMIIVTPEGNNGWYTDSATVPSDKYESYIIDELIPDVQRRYRTVETRAGRSIAGLSMGGYGALKFGVKHPELFAFAGSMSGALGAASWTETELKGLESVWRTLQPVYGAENSETRAANDLTKLFRELPAARIPALPYVYLDCGTEDALLATNRSFADILLTRKIPHEYRELPGSHSWSYWNAQVQEVLEIAARKMQPK